MTWVITAGIAGTGCTCLVLLNLDLFRPSALYFAIYKCITWGHKRFLCFSCSDHLFTSFFLGKPGLNSECAKHNGILLFFYLRRKQKKICLILPDTTLTLLVGHPGQNNLGRTLFILYVQTVQTLTWTTRSISKGGAGGVEGGFAKMYFMKYMS